MTTRKTTSSKLFQGRPNQLLLDERVSKIALPKLDANRAVMDESELQFETESLDLDETEVTEKLQIFVGVGASDSATDNDNAWDISEDDDPFFDDDDFSDDLDDVPVPMALNLTASSQEDSNVSATDVVQEPVLKPIQEVQEHETAPLLDLPEDDWSQINWEDVTLSDILGDVDEVGEDSAGAQLNLEDDAPESDMTTEEVFPALVSIEDAPTWEMAWDDDPDSDEDTAGAQVLLEDEWFSEGAALSNQNQSHNHNQSSILHVESTSTAPTTYTTNRPPPPRIVLKQPKRLWDDRLVQVWLMLLGVAFIAALGWRMWNAQ